MTKYIVVWQAYGEWKATSKLFDYVQDAQTHIDYLINQSATGRDNTDCQIISVQIKIS